MIKRFLFAILSGMMLASMGCGPVTEGQGREAEQPFIFGWKIKLHPDSRLVGGSFLEDGRPYDQPLLEATFNMLHDGGVLFDIGASTGSFSLLSKFRDIKVHAFEPNPYIASILEKNIALNGIENRVTIHKLAMSNSDKPSVLRCPVDDNGKLTNTGLGTLGTPLRFTKFQEVPIASAKMDDFVKSEQISRIDFIKIDTEGYELEVLRGGEATIKKFRPVILLEYFETNLKQAGASTEQLLDFIKNVLGYKCSKIGSEDLLCQPNDA